jgi:hypothetical protein
MDNIQKLILCVLSVAGLIAMLVPSADNMGGDGFAPPPQPVEIPAPSQTADQAQPSVTDEEGEALESELTDDDVFSMGEPAIDGNPVQGSFGSSSDAPPPLNYDTSGTTPQSYDVPGGSVAIPAPSNNG